MLGNFYRRRASTITACIRGSSARTENFWLTPTVATASSPIFEIKYTFGVDPLQQYLIEFPDGRLQALSIAWDTRPKEQRRTALVSSLSQRGDPPRRRAALDQAQPELELHVRRKPLDRGPQELRCDQRSNPDEFRRDQRRMRSLSRHRVRAMSVGRGSGVAPWPPGRSKNQQRVGNALRRALATPVGASNPTTGNAAAQNRVPPQCARRSRLAVFVMRGAANFRRTGFPATVSRHPRRLADYARALSCRRTDGGTRPTITARSSGAGCSPPT